MAQPQNPCETAARRYLANVSARDARVLAAMYAEDGWLDLPDGRRIAGRQAVLDFYLSLFERGGPTPAATSFVSDERHCIVELLAALPGGASQQAVDCFAFDAEGLIASLVVYTRNSGPQEGQ
jgi:hypothetical protein